MIVVPNRFNSIYSRLWCCYEAYLAYVMNKTIVLPRGIIVNAWVRRRCLLCLLAMACTIFCCSPLSSVWCQASTCQSLAGEVTLRLSLAGTAGKFHKLPITMLLKEGPN